MYSWLSAWCDSRGLSQYNCFVAGLTSLNLTAIVPISSFRNDSARIASWLAATNNRGITVIFVYDGPEIPEDVVKSLSVSPNVRVLKSDLRGPGAARNIGLKEVTSDFVCFWDSDDYPLIDAISAAVKELDNSGSDVAIGEYEVSYSNTEMNSPDNSTVKHTNSLVEELTGSPGLWRFVFKTETLAAVDFPNTSMGEDQVFLARFFAKERDILKLDYPVYRYVRHGDVQLTKHQESVNRLTESMRILLSELHTYDRFGRELASSMAFKQVLTVIKSCPLRIKAKTFPILIYLMFLNPVERIRQIKKLLHKRFSSEFKMVHVVLNGGLGNQLFQVAAALNFKEDRKIILEKEIGYPRRLSSGHAAVEGFSFVPEIRRSPLERNYIISKITNFQLRIGLNPKAKVRLFLATKLVVLFQALYLRKPLKVIINIGVGFSIQKVPLHRNILLVGYFQSYRYQNAEVIQTLKRAFADRTGSELDALKHRAAVDCPLIVHVRLGDYLNEPNFGIPSLEYYEEAILKLFDPDKHKAIWLFSDDIKNSLNRIPEHLRIITRVFDVVDNSDLNTLVAMTLGSDYVIANSSFSWWAARLNVNENASVAYPTPWFKNMEDPQDLMPPEWLPYEARF